MRLKLEDMPDAPVIHELMIKAFMEYKNDPSPSSALEETVQSVSEALEREEKALIAYVENQPVGMGCFQIKNEGLYFYRLSVIPQKHG
ncbi:hypothetical protein J2S78_001698 [Salibacterium salarium]|uniref:hypothetical protein n=1 Tax=Salibacterium salarium TaxID=284579 RepID=UPI002783C786|nr:hypothetical protein [Salibacterium salarium]MDQ0299278.1 hypothetical protein [Salibacterium salarium]